MKQKVQKGFTLVELIVVMVLMGVLMTAVVMILRPSQNTFKNITNKAYEEQIALNISKLLNGSLRYATGVKVVCNDGTTPTAAEFDKHKNYIKLSNNYRASSVKGARGDFERGRIDPDDKKNGPLIRVGSAITSESFDEYDFQFYIGAVNNSLENASMTIQLRAMPMEPATPEEKTIATSISKPNPSFVPYWEKFYDYSETFEFINMRHKDTISKDVTGVNGEGYELGPHVKGLGDIKGLDGFIDPLKKDNTIWIFYTNPQEAELSSGAGGAGGGTSSVTSTSGSGSGSESTGGSESNMTGTTSSEGTHRDMSATEPGAGTGGEGNGNGSENTGESGNTTENPGNGGNNNNNATEPGTQEGGTENPGGNTPEEPPAEETTTAGEGTLGTLKITILGNPAASSGQYIFNSYNDVSVTGLVGGGYSAINYTSDGVIECTFSPTNTSGTVTFTADHEEKITNDTVNGGNNVELFCYNGVFYDTYDLAASRKAKDQNEMRTVNIHFSGSKKGSYPNGEMDAGFTVDDLNAAATSSGSFILKPGESKTIMLKSTWSALKGQQTVSYDDALNGVTDVWIMNGSIYTTKPSDWAD